MKMIKKVQELGSELNNSGNVNISATDGGSDNFAQIEPTLLKLNEFINSKIKLADFTTADKANLVELFVTHQKTLMSIYFSLFPNTVNIDRKYDNLSLTSKDVKPGELHRNSSAQQDDMLGDQRMYNELLEGDLEMGNQVANESRDMSQRDMSSLFENRSISEIGKYA